VTINTDILQTSLQAKLDDTTILTESKDFLVLSKAMESVVGVIAAGEILQTGIDQVAAVVAEGDTQAAIVQSIVANISSIDVAEVRSASIDMDNNLLLRPELRNYSKSVQAMPGNDVDCTLGSVQTKSISGTSVLTFSNPPEIGSGEFTLILTLSGSPDVVWPTSVKWSGSAPTLTTVGIDVFTFITIDGGATWLGFVAGQDMT